MDDLPRSLQKPAIHCLMALSFQTQPHTGCKCWSPCPQQLSATGLISPARASVQTGPREAASTENRRLPTYFHPFFCPEVNFRPGVTGEQKGPGTSPRSPLQHQKATGQTTFPYINLTYSKDAATSAQPGLSRTQWDGAAANIWSSPPSRAPSVLFSDLLHLT